MQLKRLVARLRPDFAMQNGPCVSSKRSVPCLTERNLSDVEYFALRDTTGIIAIIIITIGTRSEHLTNPYDLLYYKNYIVGLTCSSSRGQCPLRS